MTFVSEDAKRFKREVAQIAAQDTLIYSDIEVVLKFYRPQRSGDLDNRLKCLLDALQGVVYANDSQIVRIVAERHEDKHNPRVAVQITALGLC